MATRKHVPQADNEGGLGTALKRWASAFIAAITCTTINALTLAAQAVGFTITGGTTSKTLTVDETGAMSDKAPKASPTFTTKITTPIIELTGGQIAFPATANPSANANTLDDYEEGTWTGTPVCGTSGSITATAGVNGRYIKIGNWVNIALRMSVTSVSSPLGRLTITGVPFALSGTSVASVIEADGVNGGFGDYVMCNMASSTLYVDRVLNGEQIIDFAAAFKAGTGLSVLFSYLTT